MPDMQPLSNLQSPLGFLTAYVPEELFHAAGFTPVFLFHTSEDHGHARAHLPGFTCWVAGSALDRALAGELDGLEGMALASTCDTMQGLTDIWRRNVPGIPLFHFGMVQRLDTPSARAYLLTELRSLRERVQAQTGRLISDDALRESIALYNRTRARMRRLYAHAADFSPPDLYACVRAALSSAPLPDCSPTPLSFPPSLLLVGPALADPILFDVLDQAGARVVGDLLDLGERYFAVDAADEGDPLAALADRLLGLPPGGGTEALPSPLGGGTEGGPPTPTKHHSQRSRAAHLLALARERQAHGVIFARQKFCDPHGFDYVQLAHALDQADVPYLLLELEQASQAGQLRTRVEAFVEMVAR